MASGSLGKNWNIKRVSETEVSIALPKGMSFTSENLTIEDIVEAYQKHKIMHLGETSGQEGARTSDEVSVRCCSGNTAIAAL